MAILLAIPILAVLVMFQSAVVSQIFLLHGTADLVLLAIIAWALQERVETAWHWALIGGLMVNLVSALPLGIPLIGYLLATGIAQLLKHRIWQAPILAMFTSTFLGSLANLGLNWIVLVMLGHPLPLAASFNLVILPSVLLNMLLAIPAHSLASSLAEQLYPEETITI
jgi:rod shape-determining protein MreD